MHKVKAADMEPSIREEKASIEVRNNQNDEAFKQQNSTIAFSPKQTLDRYIGFIPTVAFGANLQCSWESVAVSFQAALLNGGPTSMVWGMLIAWVGSLAMSVSLAEMASINPTVGAQYRWTSMFAPGGSNQAFWGLIQGWITVLAWVATCAQPAFFIATLSQGIVILNYENFVFEKWHGTLMAWAVLAIPVCINIFARKLLPTVEVVGAITHVSFFIVFVVTLCVLAPRSSSKFVFATNIFGLSGWKNTSVQWCIGLLSAAFPIGGFDGVLHMSDEVKDAPTKIPLAMIYSVVINGAMAFSFIVVILFCLGDFETALATPTGYPIMQVVYGATGSKAATSVFTVFIVFNALISMFSSLASVSRLTWAFAKDNGLPFSTRFSTVHPTLCVPLNALTLVAVLIALIQLLNIGSTSALYAIVSLSTIGLYLSYLFPILFILLAKLRGDQIAYGPFKLGRIAGIATNAFAVVYCLFVLIWLPFPPYMPVTSENMNYAGPMVAAVLVFAITDWFLLGRKRFQAPDGFTGQRTNHNVYTLTTESNVQIQRTD